MDITNIMQVTDPFSDSVILYEMSKPHHTINTFVAIDRTVGPLIGLTDHSSNVAIDGVVYYSDGGVTPNNNISKSNLALDTNELVSLFSQNTITKEQVLKWNLDNAKIRVFLADRENPVFQHTLRDGYLGATAVKNNLYSLEVVGKLYKINHQVGRTYSVSCDAKLFSTRCGVNPIGFTSNGTVLSVSNSFTVTVNIPSVTQPSGFYNNGIIKITSGPNINLSLEVKEDIYVSGNTRTIELYEAFPSAITPSVTLQLTAGCDKTAATCIAKFNNIVNFQGHPFVSSGEPHGDHDTQKSKTLKS